MKNQVTFNPCGNRWNLRFEPVRGWGFHECNQRPMKLTRRSIKWSKLWKCFRVEPWWYIALLPLMHCLHIKQCIKTKKVRPTKKPWESPMATTSRSSSKQRERELCCYLQNAVQMTTARNKLSIERRLRQGLQQTQHSCTKHNRHTHKLRTLSPLSNHSAKSQRLKQKNHQVCTHAHTKFVQYTCAWTLVDQPASDKEMTHSW